MTPFDPTALLAMLLAFYPVVGPAALARARLERPEYFAAATIVSTGQDKIQLPDGRVFDCIFDVGGPAQHWQMVEIHADGRQPGADDPFALEPGPLDPIDESAFDRTPYHPVFLPLVAGGLGELRAVDDGLVRARGVIVQAAARGDVAAALAPIDDAGDGLGAAHLALDQVHPEDLTSATEAQGSAAGLEETRWTEPPPDEFSTPDLPPPPTEPDEQQLPESQA